MTLASSIIVKARIVNYHSRIVICSFIVLATVSYCHYDRKTFIVEATGTLLIQNFPLFKSLLPVSDFKHKYSRVWMPLRVQKQFFRVFNEKPVVKNLGRWDDKIIENQFFLSPSFNKIIKVLNKTEVENRLSEERERNIKIQKHIPRE